MAEPVTEQPTEQKPNNMVLDKTTFIIVSGLQGGGKSHFIRYLMYRNRKRFNWGIVFTNTGFAGDNFDYIPQKYVHPVYNQKALLSLMNVQKKLIGDGKSPEAFVIFDDCLFGKQWNDNEFKSLITQLRHYHVTCIISCQYPQSIPSLFRANVFQVIMFYMNAQNAIKALYESYGQMFDSYTQFKKYLLEHTGNYQFIHYDAKNGGQSISSRYTAMKAPDKIPKFTIRYTNRI
jgi:hypothetical protein